MNKKDLGIMMQDMLSSEKHINKLFGVTYRVMQNIGVSFQYMYNKVMKKITMIEPKFEIPAVVWSPHKEKKIRTSERVENFK